MQIIQSTKNLEHLTRVVGGACGITDLPSSGGHPFQKQGQHNGEWPLTSQQCLSYTSHPGHYKYINTFLLFLSFFLSLSFLFIILPAAGTFRGVRTRLEKVGTLGDTGDAITFAPISMM